MQNLKNKKALAAASALAMVLASSGWAQTFVPSAPVSGAATPGSTRVVAPIVKGRGGSVMGTVAGALQAAGLALQRGDTANAVEQYRSVINTDDEGQRAQARYGLAVALDQLGQDSEALQILESTPADDSPLGQAIGALRGNLVLQLAETAWWQPGAPGGGVSGVARWLDQYDHLTVQPDSARATLLRSYLSAPTPEMATVSSTAPVAGDGKLTVGVLLPLSGPLASVGQEILQGIQLGLAARQEEGGSQVVVRLFDTAIGAKAAAQAARDAQVSVVVGPVLAPDVREASAVLKPAGVPMLSLSSDRSVTGPGVWSLSYSPSGQARAVARWAVANGRGDVAGLVPSNPYGQAAWEAFADEVRKQGGRVVSISFFNPDNVDISASVRSLMGTKTKKPGQSVGFSALFIPAPAPSMALITSQLAYYDLDQAGVQLLGPALWQDARVLDGNNGTAAALLKGAVFGAPPKTDGFDDDFRATFADARGTDDTTGGKGPSVLASVGGDAGRLMAELAAVKGRLHASVSDLLLRPQGFPGYGGFMRFSTDGRSLRNEAVVQITGGKTSLSTTPVSGSAAGAVVSQSEVLFSVVKPALSMAPLPLPHDLRPSAGGRSTGVW